MQVTESVEITYGGYSPRRFKGDKELENLGKDLAELELQIYKLEDKLKIKVIEKKYRQAESIRTKLMDLKKFFTQKKKEVLTLEHDRANSLFEATRSREFSEFKKYWDFKLDEFEDDVHALKSEMKEKQKDDLRDYIDSLESILPTRVHTTTEIIHLKKKEQNLVKIGKYLEADKTVKQITKLERALVMKLEKRREEIAEKHIDTFTKKQKQELGILKLKVKSKREELEKQRKIEFDRLTNKYRNVRKEMDLVQGIERSKLQMILDKDVSIKHMESMENRHSSIQSGIFGGYKNSGRSVSPLKRSRDRLRPSRGMNSGRKSLRSKEAKAWKEKMFGTLKTSLNRGKYAHGISTDEIQINDESQGEAEPANQVSRLDKEKLVERHYQEDSPGLQDGVVTKALVIEPQEVEIIKIK